MRFRAPLGNPAKFAAQGRHHCPLAKSQHCARSALREHIAALREVNAMKPGRNDPCHCGSEQKYKKCCAAKDAAASSAELQARNAELQAAREAALAEAEAQAATEDGAGASEASETNPRAKRPKLPTPYPSNRTRTGA